MDRTTQSMDPSRQDMLPAAKLPRREGMKAVEKLYRSAVASSGAEPGARPMTTASGGNAARRHQSHLDDDPPAVETAALPSGATPVAPAAALASVMEWRGGPQKLEDLKLRVLSKNDHFLVLNKCEDHRLDGQFDATIEKALYRDFPEVQKFRWIHQLDFATSGVMIVGVEKDATALACKLFREKCVQKEYLAVVRGHLPFHPKEHYGPLDELQDKHRVRACALSKIGLLIQDTEDFDRYKTQMKGTRVHQKHRDYPRGVRQGPAFLEMERNELLKVKAAGTRSLTEDEERLVGVKWADLQREEQLKYKELSNADKIRFMKELSVFLDDERARVSAKRQYEVSAEGAEPDEPVAYLFDDPIAEPGRDSFRMRIGDRTNVEDVAVSGRSAATIAFVLGHATFENEAVTKVLLRPLTGRRHQLRLHLSHNGFPIIGDATYASENETAPRMMLHAWRLWLMADASAREKYGDLHFESPDPFEEIVPSKRTLTTMTYQKIDQQDS